MPNQCVRCKNYYEDDAKELLQGCSCGARLFFYVKKKSDSQPVVSEQVEKEVLELVDSKKPVVLDWESISLSEGGYEINLEQLFKKEPVVLRLEEGKYVIDMR